MSSKVSAPFLVFDKVLRDFGAGGFTYSDVLAQLKRLLASGTPPAQLLETVRRRESIEPLPDYAHAEVLRVINDAIAHSDSPPAAPEVTSAAAAPAPERGAAPTPLRTPTRAAPPAGGTPAPTPSATPVPLELVRPTAVDVQALTARVRSMEERIARQTSDQETLTRNFERARDAEMAAVARAGALAKELAAERAALGSAQRRIRELEKSMAERIAAAEAARARSEEAVREAERRQSDAHTLREALAEREAALAQAHHSLAARDTQLAALQQEHARVVPELASRAQLATRLEAQLQQARAQSEEALREAQRRESESRGLRDSLAARDAELATVRAALESEGARAAEIERVLSTKVRASDQARSRAEALLREAHAGGDAELEAQLSDARTRVSELAAELTAARAALESQQSRADEIERVLTAKVRASEAARDAELAASATELAALLEERSTLLRTLDAQRRDGGRLEADLQAAHARADALSADLQESEEAAATFAARLARGEADLDAARAELAAAKSQSSSYLELLRTHAWRSEFEQTAQRDAAAPAATVTPAEVAPAEARAPTVAAAPSRPVVASSPPAMRGPGASSRGVWLGAAALLVVLGVIAWRLAQHPRTTAAAPAAAAPPAVAVPKPGTVFRDCPDCPAMTVLPTGRFKQGSSRTDGTAKASEKPLHWVLITHPIALSTNAVTVDEFDRFVAATGRNMQGCDIYEGSWKHRSDNSWKNPGFKQTGTHPVACVSWNDADAYAKWLSKTTGRRYRLPSASEWEFAARAGADDAQPWGADAAGACAHANVADQSAARRYRGWAAFACDDGYVYTAPVGSFKANAFGLNDMLGNVFQWTQDCWHADYVGAPIDGSARMDGDCAEHELRGGSWFSTPAYVRADYRNHFASDYRTSSVGIRVVRDLEP